MSSRILQVLRCCSLSVENIIAIVTDGGETSSAACIGTENILWIWCCVHLLSLAFQDSFKAFPQHPHESKALWLVMLRKVVNLFVCYFDKLKPYLPIPSGCKKVICTIIFSVLRKENLKRIVILVGWVILTKFF